MPRPYGVILAVVMCVLPIATFRAVAQNTRIDSFEQAKKLAPQMYADHLQEFYCFNVEEARTRKGLRPLRSPGRRG